MTTKTKELKPTNGTAEKPPTGEQVAKAVNKLLEQYGYGLSVSIIDQRSGLDVTESMRQQWGYVPHVQVAKKQQ